jgi:hypothetical protein
MAQFANPELPSHSGLCGYCNKLNFEKLRLPLASEVEIFRFLFERQDIRRESSFSQRLGGSQSDEELINSRPLNERQGLEEDVEVEELNAESIYHPSFEEMVWADKIIESDGSNDALIGSQSPNYKYGLDEDTWAGNLDENSIANKSPGDIQRAGATETEEANEGLIINQSFQEVQITDGDTKAQEMKYVEEGHYGAYMGKIPRVEESSGSCLLCKAT